MLLMLLLLLLLLLSLTASHLKCRLSLWVDSWE